MNKFFLDATNIPFEDNKFAIEQYLVANLNKLSSAYRGEVIKNINKHNVDIIGGDLSYGKIKDPLLLINKENNLNSKEKDDITRKVILFLPKQPSLYQNNICDHPCLFVV